MNSLLILSAFVCLTGVYSAPTKSVDHVDFLRKFGYLLSDKSELIYDADAIKKAISEYQVNAGITITGSMNEETEDSMKIPRCGRPDKVSHSSLHHRTRRYNTFKGFVWKHLNITYKITEYTRKVSHTHIDEAAAKALNFWGEVTQLNFRQVSPYSKADIDIKFVVGDHGDGLPFDGKWGIIGHAFPPEYGLAHFDDAESWVIGECDDASINILQVMTHEFGHSLGLAHSFNRSNVMFPNYKGYEPNFALSGDDIKGIQSLYGSKSGYSSTKTPTDPATTLYTTTTTEEITTIKKFSTERSTTTTDNIQTTTKDNGISAICKNTEFDAVVFDNGYIKAFKGFNYYNINTRKHRKLAHSIRSTFLGAPSHIEAALTIHYRVILFKKGLVYSYVDHFYDYTLESGFPKQASEMFPGIPDYIDAAFEKQGKVYFLSRGSYYSGIFKLTGSMPVSPTAAPIIGLPARIDGAYSVDLVYAFFFSGDNFYRIDDDSDKISEQGKISQYFLDC